MAFERKYKNSTVTIKAGDYPGYTEKELINLSGCAPHRWIEYDGEIDIVIEGEIYDNLGNEITPAVMGKEPTKLWRFMNNSELKELEAEETKQNIIRQYKEERNIKMATCTVERNGVQFWADPGSEQNFQGRIREMELNGKTQTKWIQGDQVYTVSLDDLRYILAEGTKKNAAFYDEYIAKVESL